ncbi:hypothetical protein BDV40DRAFT_304531 [Aspergillus tamarii]|uniref:Uncharacterized protein n=1 Tax=Aspergillus tamarii TaxID=41984 RepID=A0A5N6UHL8_ASPTM|nr:hypothetical protein BDV40DRAFT_304531 [Aspergillus tamarii]
MTVTPSTPITAGQIVYATEKPGTPREYVNDIKLKAWADNNWAGMLSAAPVCLELLGSCCLVASSEIARTTTIKKPEKGFKYLKGHTYLSSYLVEVSNQGRVAFNVARKNMMSINLHSLNATKQVKEITETLLTEPFEPGIAGIKLDTLKTLASSCVECSFAMEKEFATWLNYIMELHEACQDTEGANAGLFQNILSKEEANRIYQAEKERIVKQQTDRVEEQDKKVKEALDWYKAAKDDFPTKDDLMKQQLIMMGAELASSVVKIAATAVAAYASPASAFALGGEAVKDVASANKGPDSKSASATTSEKSNENSGQTQKKSRAKTDPALVRCPLVLQCLEAFNELLEKQIDWSLITGSSRAGKEENVQENRTEKKETAEVKVEKAQGKETKKPRMNLVQVELLLQRTLKDIKKAKDEHTSTGEKLRDILDDALKVASELNVQREKSQDINWKALGDDSTEVKNWRKTVAGLLSKAQKLHAKSMASIQQAVSRPPLLFKLSDNSEKEIQARKDLCQQTIDSARTKLQISLDALTAQQETAHKMAQECVKLQNELASIRQEIASLDAQKTTLEEVRRVLRNCITFLIQLKEQVARLTIFFSTVAALVDTADKSHVQPFTKYVADASTQLSQQKRLSQHYINVIYQYAMEVGASFSLYIDISDMYIQVDSKYILDGLNLVDKMGQLSIPREDQPGSREKIEEKKKELSNYSETAQAGINEIVQKQTDAITKMSQERVEQLKRLLSASENLPIETPIDHKMIKDAVAESTNVIQQQIEADMSVVKQLGSGPEVRDANAEKLVRFLIESCFLPGVMTLKDCIRN